MKTRPLWVFIHRYSGLAMPNFLVVGLTGGLPSFDKAFDIAIYPPLYAQTGGHLSLETLALIKHTVRHIAPLAAAQSLWISSGRHGLLKDDALSAYPKRAGLGAKP